MWEKIYPGKARQIQLNGLPCLLMPYGTRVMKEEKYLSLIEAELKKFCEHGYMYERSDLCWRHVLLGMDNKLFLADLGSLGEWKKVFQISSGKGCINVDQVVESQMKHLKEGIENVNGESNTSLEGSRKRKAEAISPTT